MQDALGGDLLARVAPEAILPDDATDAESVALLLNPERPLRPPAPRLGAAPDPNAPCSLCGRSGSGSGGAPPKPTWRRFTAHVGADSQKASEAAEPFEPNVADCYVLALGMLLLLPGIMFVFRELL